MERLPAAIVLPYRTAGLFRLWHAGLLFCCLLKASTRNFELVLVYDVSRWGRFQDTDESAYYEFICKLAGVSIEYCAEPFENDGSAITTLVKAMKRVMAGEYSRDLSVKITREHRRLAGMGFHQGGKPNYGLRRLLVDKHRNKKFQLQDGELKGLNSDHVILVPGPEHEVRIVQSIFQLYAVERISIRQIIRILAKANTRNARGTPWSIQNILDILSCEKYASTFVYNRSSERLHGRRTYHLPNQWLRVENAIEPIIDQKIFAEAQCRLSETWKVSDIDLLNYLTAMWCTNGFISNGTLNRSRTAPSTCSDVERFGSLRNAYRLIGFRTSHLYRYNGISDVVTRIDRDLICSTISNVHSKDDKPDMTTGLNFCELMIMSRSEQSSFHTSIARTVGRDG